MRYSDTDSTNQVQLCRVYKLKLGSASFEKTKIKLALYELAEGVGFEPTTPLTRGKRLAGARTRPLCDPPQFGMHYYIITGYATQKITGGVLL